MSRILVVGEIALSCALLVMAGLMVRGALEKLRTDGVFATENVLTARYELRPEAYDDEEVVAFHRRLLDLLAEHAGVEAAALTTHLPGVPARVARVEVEGREVQEDARFPRTHRIVVSPGFFESVGSEVTRGRPFTWADGVEGYLPVVVNEAFVQSHFPDRDPLGARLRLVTGVGSEPGPWATVVGVAPPLGIEVGGDPDATAVYLPTGAEPARRMAVLLRARTDPLGLAATLRGSLAELDPDIALYEMGTLEEQIRATRAVESVFAALFLSFGLAGLLLAGVGLYGVVTFGVRRRVRELGVRMALGAAPGRVLRTAVGGGLLQLVVGLGAGLGIAAAVAPMLGLLLLGVSPREPTVYALVTAALVVTGLVAFIQPARRALGVDVVEALRTE